MTVTKELYKYRSDFMVVQVKWEGNGTESAEYTFLYEKGNENHEFGAGFLCI
jgi:hypothetical protein